MKIDDKPLTNAQRKKLEQFEDALRLLESGEFQTILDEQSSRIDRLEKATPKAFQDLAASVKVVLDSQTTCDATIFACLETLEFKLENHYHESCVGDSYGRDKMPKFVLTCDSPAEKADAEADAGGG